MLLETADGTTASRHASDKPRPGLVLVYSGVQALFRPFPLDSEGAPFVAGRAGPAGVFVSDERLSRQHAEISLTSSGWRVRDLGSRNGTYVDGVQIKGEVNVASLRVVRAGDTLFVACEDVDHVSQPARSGPVVGSRLRAAFDDVARAAAQSETLLILGESGTGKELAATCFHERGPNARGPFVAVNCAAIPAGLAERLLFGAKRGAYSGAVADTQGHIQAADGGVLFLDELAELDLQVQAKLLRVLETREIVPLGASHGTRITARICMATHQNLRQAVAERRFRGDLYHRISPPEVVLPPLRERLDEIPQHVAQVVAAATKGLAPQARFVEACILRRWPGNVRELRRQVNDAALRAAAEGADRVRFEHLPASAGVELEATAASDVPAAVVPSTPSSSTHPPPPPSPSVTPSASAPATPSSASKSTAPRSYVRWSGTLTREVLERALTDHAGNASAAARSLGMARQQIYREMARLGVKPTRADDEDDS